VAVLALAVGLAFWGNRGSHLELQGQVLKARTGALDEQNCIAVLDFRISNPSNVSFVVRDVKVTLLKANGDKVDGDTVSKMDLNQVFAYNRFLGSQYNDGLSIKDKVPAHGQIDRMVAARFPVPQSELERGKAIVLWIQDMDGAEFETQYKLNGK
jgi:hypothetical protein